MNDREFTLDPDLPLKIQPATCNFPGCEKRQRWVFDTACRKAHGEALLHVAAEMFDGKIEQREDESLSDAVERRHYEVFGSMHMGSRWTPHEMQQRIDEFRTIVDAEKPTPAELIRKHR